MSNPYETELVTALAAFDTARRTTADQLERLAGAQRRFNEAEARHILAGLDGSNVQVRTAQLVQKLAREQAELDTANSRCRQAQAALDAAEARLHIARLRYAHATAEVNLRALTGAHHV